MDLMEMQKDISNLVKYLRNNYKNLTKEERFKKIYELNMKRRYVEEIAAKKYFETRRGK